MYHMGLSGAYTPSGARLRLWPSVVRRYGRRMRTVSKFPIKPAIVSGLLLLAACGEPGLNERQQDEATDLATDAATDAISSSQRIAELEARVDELEARLGG